MNALSSAAGRDVMLVGLAVPFILDEGKVQNAEKI